MLIIGIAGGTGSGKTTVVRKIISKLPEDQVAILSQDSYYKDMSHIPLAERQEMNFDHPNAIEWSLLINHLLDLKQGKTVEQPIYSYLTCTRSQDTITVHPRKVIIVEGILVLTCKELRELFDIKVFVQADPDDRLIRVMLRDIIERGRTVEATIERYQQTVKPMHIEFIEPSKSFADIIVPQGGNNKVAIDILSNIIKLNIS